MPDATIDELLAAIESMQAMKTSFLELLASIAILAERLRETDTRLGRAGGGGRAPPAMTEPGAPLDLKPISINDLKRLGIGPDNQLYWDGRAVEVRRKLALVLAAEHPGRARGAGHDRDRHEQPLRVPVRP